MKIRKTLALGMVYLSLSFPIFAQTSGQLSFSCKTTAPSANWGDKHVAAIWIQNNDNPSVFIKTNAKYGHDDDHLTSWRSISNSNMVDAISGATLSTYGTLSIVWDGTDAAHNVVMDGEYSIYIEMGWGKDKTNDHASSMFAFTKGTNAIELTPSDADHFSEINLAWKPTTTLINASENEKGICIFPNPSNGLINLNIHEELEQAKIEITDLAGKIMYTEELPHISLGVKSIDSSTLPTGMYFLTIYSANSQISYKILNKQ